jgi:hypothetical protein
LSPATQQSYLYAVAKFSRHFGRSPDRLGLEEVRTYQLHLIAQQRSWFISGRVRLRPGGKANPEIRLKSASGVRRT